MNETLPEKLERHKRELTTKLQKAQQSGYDKAEKILISEFLKAWDHMMDRIVFHTENPDSELLDEVMEEYMKWEARLEP